VNFAYLLTLLRLAVREADHDVLTTAFFAYRMTAQEDNFGEKGRLCFDRRGALERIAVDIRERDVPVRYLWSGDRLQVLNLRGQDFVEERLPGDQLELSAFNKGIAPQSQEVQTLLAHESIRVYYFSREKSGYLYAWRKADTGLLWTLEQRDFDNRRQGVSLFGATRDLPAEPVFEIPPGFTPRSVGRDKP